MSIFLFHTTSSVAILEQKGGTRCDLGDLTSEYVEQRGLERIVLLHSVS